MSKVTTLPWIGSLVCSRNIPKVWNPTILRKKISRTAQELAAVDTLASKFDEEAEVMVRRKQHARPSTESDDDLRFQHLHFAPHAAVSAPLRTKAECSLKQWIGSCSP